MTTPTEPPRPPLPSNGQHLASISHAGRFWEVYLEFSDDPRRPSSYRGLLCFSPADSEGEAASHRTTAIIIEESYEEAVRKARGFKAYQLQGLLRSVLPEEDDPA